MKMRALPLIIVVGIMVGGDVKLPDRVIW